MFEFHGWVKQEIIKQEITKEQVSEALRQAFVNYMRSGATLVVNFDTIVPFFKEKYDNSISPCSDLLFNRENLLKNYKQILKPEEDTDLEGNHGMYFMSSDFSLILLINMEEPHYTDSILQRVLDQVPNQEQFLKIYITRSKDQYEGDKGFIKKLGGLKKQQFCPVTESRKLAEVSNIEQVPIIDNMRPDGLEPTKLTILIDTDWDTYCTDTPLMSLDSLISSDCDIRLTPSDFDFVQNIIGKRLSPVKYEAHLFRFIKVGFLKKSIDELLTEF